MSKHLTTSECLNEVLYTQTGMVDFESDGHWFTHAWLYSKCPQISVALVRNLMAYIFIWLPGWSPTCTTSGSPQQFPRSLMLINPLSCLFHFRLLLESCWLKAFDNWALWSHCFSAQQLSHVLRKLQSPKISPNAPLSSSSFLQRHWNHWVICRNAKMPFLQFGLEHY